MSFYRSDLCELEQQGYSIHSDSMDRMESNIYIAYIKTVINIVWHYLRSYSELLRPSQQNL